LLPLNSLIILGSAAPVVVGIVLTAFMSPMARLSRFGIVVGLISEDAKEARDGISNKTNGTDLASY